MKKFLRNIRLILFISFFAVLLAPNNICLAQDDLTVNGFDIIPELNEEEIGEINEKIKRIWSEWWHVWDHYNDEASQLSTSKQIASWIMNRDTIMNYLIFVVQFLSQLWLVVWAVFIIYAWYNYMLSVFKWWQTPTTTIKNAILWVLVVIFSYAIMRVLTSLIWLT